MVAPHLPADARDPLTAALREFAPTGPLVEARLAAAIDQAVAHPGKLVRARLVHAAACVHGADPDHALQLAVAIEYFHIASLLLDDLPCMDDAQTRRGLVCAHRVHGEAPAILAALALINRAYALIGFAMAGEPVPVRLAAMGCLDAALGVAGLVGGQAHDLAFARGEGRPREVGRIAAAKTGALFWLAVYFPALLAQPTGAEGRRLKALCTYWGLAFQALDDWGDVIASRLETGKAGGRDAALRRPNLVHALGRAGARRRLARLVDQAGRMVAALELERPVWSYLGQFHREFFVANADRLARNAEVLVAA